MRLTAAVLLGTICCCLEAQTTDPRFEVASVKVSTSGRGGVRGGCRGIDSKTSTGKEADTLPLGRCVITNGRLSHMIAIAWNLPVQSILGAPDWVMWGERFTLEAKAEDSATTTEAQLLAMLRNLLVDRFRLKFRLEDRLVPGFALTVGKREPKLRESKSDVPGISFGDSKKPGLGGPVTVDARRLSMGSLATLLTQIGQIGPVMDQTGLAGFYDFRLAWDDNAGPSLSTALQEQMGLRLTKSQKVPVAQFVFESAERPAAN